MQDHSLHAASQTASSFMQAATGSGDFLPHGYCFLWNRPLLLTHVTSDVLIGASYVAISFSLAWLVHRARKDIPFSAVFIAFGLFIVTCGLTHFIEVYTFWKPAYWTLGSVKVVTALASLTTAAAMPFTIPRVLGTVRDARLAREREVAAARAEVLAQQNATLEAQATELEKQRAEARALADELARTNARLVEALELADLERTRAEQAAMNALQARIVAEEANQSKAQFLATMSHELRTPLNAIAGYVDLIDMGLRGPVTDAQRSDLSRVRRAQQHLLSIINDILNHARIEAGQVEYSMEAVACDSVVRDTVTMLEPAIRAKGQELHVDAAAELHVRADRERLSQVLVNLVSNANKYTPAKGRIEVVARSSNGTVTLHVRDNGPGIAPDKHETIFEPFVQAVTGLSRPHEGAGLGLTISRKLARGMGGDLEVRSRPGEGAEFIVTLEAAHPSVAVPA